MFRHFSYNRTSQGSPRRWIREDDRRVLVLSFYGHRGDAPLIVEPTDEPDPDLPADEYQRAFIEMVSGMMIHQNDSLATEMRRACVFAFLKEKNRVV